MWCVRGYRQKASLRLNTRTGYENNFEISNQGRTQSLPSSLWLISSEGGSRNKLGVTNDDPIHAHWPMTLTFNVRKCNIEQFLQKEEILLRKICDHLHTCLQMLSSSLQLNFPNWFAAFLHIMAKCALGKTVKTLRWKKPNSSLIKKKKKRFRCSLVWNANMLSAKEQNVLPDIERAHSKTFLSHPCFRYLPFRLGSA